MTWTQLLVLVIAVFGYGAVLGWLAGSRWRRAHDAARYAQIALRAERAAARRAAAGPRVVIDYSFAVNALARSGFDVVPVRPPQEGLH